MKRLLLLSLAAISLNAQTLNPAVPAPISFTLANTDPTGSCNNPSLFYFNFVNSAMWGCQVQQNARIGTWVQQNPAVGGGVTSVNGQTGAVSLTIPTDNAQLTNNAGYATAAQVPGLSAVTSVNGLTGTVNVGVPTLVSQLTNDSAFITAANAPVLSVNGLTGAITLPSANNYQTVKANGVAVTQRAKLNVAAGANTTVTATDNGTDTTTLTIDTVGGGGGGLPDPGANGLVKRTALNTTSAAVNGTDYYGPGFTIPDADLPATITSDITGNAGTATALKTAPTGCAGSTFIQQIGANGNPVSCGSATTGGPSVTTGTALPLSSNCSSTSVGSAYIQTGNVNNSGGSALFVCSNTGSSVGSGYNWVPQNGHQVNVMSFGCKADASTDDQPCFQAAINLAKVLNHYSTLSGFYGADVYAPCGAYKINSPLVFPRTNAFDYSWGTTNGGVGLIGENIGCTILRTSTGSGWNGVTGAWLVMTGSGYTSTPTVTFTGGCTTEPTGTAILMGSTGFIADVFLNTLGSGCTSMPTCTITGGGGTGGTCMALGHGVIEFDIEPAGTFLRTGGFKLKNLEIDSPAVPGTMAFHFQVSNPPNTAGCGIGGGTSDPCERLDTAEFENVHVLDSNTNNPASFAFNGDCINCSFHNVDNNPSLSTTAFQTVLVITDRFAGAVTNEGEGFQQGVFDTVGCGGERGGSAPCFQGRAVRVTFRNMGCGTGIASGTWNPACFAFYNSAGVIMQNITQEGTPGTQYLFQNSINFLGYGIGIGSAKTATGIPAPIGMQFISSSGNRFEGSIAGGTSYVTDGGLRVSVDSNSFQNQFLNFQLFATGEVSGVSGSVSNYMQYCLIGSCNTSSAWLHLGTSPF